MMRFYFMNDNRETLFKLLHKLMPKLIKGRHPMIFLIWLIR